MFNVNLLTFKTKPRSVEEHEYFRPAAFAMCSFSSNESFSKFDSMLMKIMLKMQNTETVLMKVRKHLLVGLTYPLMQSPVVL